MKVEQKEVTKLVITDTEHVHYSYGAINVYLEDFGLIEDKYNSGKILIECDGDSWAKYWFSMGCNLIEFLSSTSVNYLTNKLVPSDECYEVDMDELTKELKQELFKQRREKDIDALSEALSDNFAEKLKVTGKNFDEQSAETIDLYAAKVQYKTEIVVAGTHVSPDEAKASLFEAYQVNLEYIENAIAEDAE